MLTGTSESSSTVVMTLSSLTMDLVSGTVYRFMYRLPWLGRSTTNGLKLGIVFPAARIAVATARITNTDTGIAASEIAQVINASGEFIATTAPPAADTQFDCSIEGTLVCTADGKLMVILGSEVTGASGNLVLPGANGICWNMGAITLP